MSSLAPGRSEMEPRMEWQVQVQEMWGGGGLTLNRGEPGGWGGGEGGWKGGKAGFDQ